MPQPEAVEDGNNVVAGRSPVNSGIGVGAEQYGRRVMCGIVLSTVPVTFKRDPLSQVRGFDYCSTHVFPDWIYAIRLHW